MKKRLFLLIFASVFLLAACSPDTSVVEESVVESEVAAPEIPAEESVSEEAEPAEEPTGKTEEMAEVSFSEDVWPILEKFALAAHGGKGGVFLESYADIMNYVEPGNPEGSLLYRALIGDGMKQMPPGNPLPIDLIETIYNWIEQGAIEN